MALEGELDYALVRVQARHGARLGPPEWQRLEASRDLAHFLDALRSSSLAPWSATLDSSDDSHAIERTMRAQWRSYVELLASWHPRPWQPWLAWLGWLPTLPLVTRFASPDPAPHWLLADPVCGPLALGSPAERSAALRRSPLAPLEAAIGAHQPLARLWRAHWLRLAPAMSCDERALLTAFLALLDRHATALGRADESALLREDLAAGVARLFRRSAGTVISSLCHLALLALDLERLRGDLARRRLFIEERA